MLLIALMSVLLLFIDGLGIGTRGPHNPLDGLVGSAPLASFLNERPAIPFDGILHRLMHVLASQDVRRAPRARRQFSRASMLPQLSATQTRLPNQALLDIIREHSIFLQLKRAGVAEITFANTYTQQFFERRPRWISATTAAVEAAGLRFNIVSDLKAGRAVFHDFTNAMLIERGEDVDCGLRKKPARSWPALSPPISSRSTSTSSRTRWDTRKTMTPRNACSQCWRVLFALFWLIWI